MTGVETEAGVLLGISNAVLEWYDTAASQISPRDLQSCIEWVSAARTVSLASGTAEPAEFTANAASGIVDGHFKQAYRAAVCSDSDRAMLDFIQRSTVH